MFSRVAGLASLTVVAALFVGAPTVQAQTGLTCVFSGQSGHLNPDIQSIASDNPLGDPQGPFDIETGDYDFAGTGSCGGMVRNIPVVMANATFTSVGSYDNIKCGTGFAHDLDGSGTNISAVNLLGGNTVGIGPATVGGTNIGYEIFFRGSAGDLVIGPDGRNPTVNLVEPLLPDDNDADGAGPDIDRTTVHSDSGRRPHPAVDSDYSGSGHVHIVPGAVPAPAGNGNPADGNCIDTSVDQFKVNGYFVIAGP
jgi:hypothetical protein